MLRAEARGIEGQHDRDLDSAAIKVLEPRHAVGAWVLQEQLVQHREDGLKRQPSIFRRLDAELFLDALDRLNELVSRGS